MTGIPFPESHHPSPDVPDERDPGAPPVEPDQGPPPFRMPEDPEHPRVIDPEARQARPAQRTRRQVEEGACP